MVPNNTSLIIKLDPVNFSTELDPDFGGKRKRVRESDA